MFSQVEWADQRLNGTSRWYSEEDFVDRVAQTITDALAQYCAENDLGDPLTRGYECICN